MISTIAFCIATVALVLIGFLLLTGTVIATVALIDFWRVYGKAKTVDEYETSQDLKQTAKALEEQEQKTNVKPCVDTTNARGFFGKLHDISIMALWAVLSAIWYVAICILGTISGMIDLICACFKRKKTHD